MKQYKLFNTEIYTKLFFMDEIYRFLSYTLEYNVECFSIEKLAVLIKKRMGSHIIIPI